MNLFFEIKTDIMTIPYITYKNKKYFSEKLVNKYNILKGKANEKKQILVEYGLYDKLNYIENLFNSSEYLFRLYNIDNKSICYINSEYVDDKLVFYISNTNKNELKYRTLLKNNTTKYNTIILNSTSPNTYERFKHMTYCDRQKILIEEYYLKILSNLLNILEPNGNMLFNLLSVCENKEIDYLYLLSFMFKKITIFNKYHIYCETFLGFNSKITKEIIDKIIKEKEFQIESKHNINNLIDYYNKLMNYGILVSQLLLDEKYNEYVDLWFLKFYKSINQFGNIGNKRVDINIHKSLFEYLKKSYKNEKINESENTFISDIIKNNNYKKCLEIGCGLGISALYILSNTKSNLISIDPFQKIQWKNIGIKMIKELKYEKRHTLMTKKSYEAMPKLLKKYGELSFDFILIDGWHTFDYTLMDFFYSNLLLKVGGTIVIDDASHPGVAEFISNITKNNKSYEKIESPYSIAVYKKIKNINRRY